MKQEVSHAGKVLINGLNIDEALGAPIDQTSLTDVRSLLVAVQKNIDKSQVVASVHVNGKPMNENVEEDFGALSIDELQSIEIFTSSPQDLAYETLNTIEQYMERILQNIDRAALHYESANILSADAYFVKALDGLDLFVQSIGSIKVAIRIGLNTKLGLAEAGLMSTVNELLIAKKQNNYVFMVELLRKDLTENLMEWKTEVFPVFRSWKTS